MENLMLILTFLAHTLIGFYFVFFGFWNIYHWRSTIEMMLERSLPHPWLVLSISIVWQIVAGFMILLGFYTKLAAVTLIPFTLISIFVFHSFWKFHGEHRLLHFTLFITHLTINVAALILLLH